MKFLRFSGGRSAAALVLAGGLWLGGTGPAAVRAQTTAPGPKRPGAPATAPVRNTTPDPNEPVTPPPPGVVDPGRDQVPGALRKPAPNSVTGAADSSALGGVRGAGGDSLNVQARRRGQVESTVKYAAKDSIRFDVTQKVAKLYSKANVDYGAMNLKAALITVDYGRNTVLANGKRDSLTNKVEGRPVFKDAAGLYTAGQIAYNFKTKKGKIADVVTQQGEGYIHAEQVKKMPDNTAFGRHGYYTTCNLAHPHFYINASKMKVIPGKKVITGPFNLVIGDVPLPLGLPFGYFPTPNKSRGSGVIIPTFGQAQDRGYFLTNGGYYWAPNDYIGVRLTGDLYAGNAERFGGWGATADVSYLKRYRYSGSFRLTYTQRPGTQILGTGTANTSPEYRRPITANTFWLTWSHAPTPRPGGGRFAASVQAGSSDYNRQNTLDPRRYLSATFSSTVSYTKQIRNSPVNYSIRAAQSQNTQTGVMDFTLPDLTVGVARQFPYQWLGIQPRGRFYEQFAIGYTLVGQNRISNLLPARQLEGGLPLLGGSTTATNIPISFANVGRLLRNAQNGVQHQFQITVPGFRLFNHVQVQPGVNYAETWYSSSLNYRFVPAAQAVRIDTVRGFNRVYSYSANVSATTNFFGLLQIKGKKIEAIRHKVAPSLSYSYSPDLRTAFAQRTELVGRDPAGAITGGIRDPYGRFLDPRTFSRYQGFAYGASGSGPVSQISLSVQNQVEMKVRDRNDTTGTNPFKKVSLIDGLDFNLGYNFLADSLRLSPLGVIFRTQIAKKLNLNAQASFEFYQRDSTGRTINRFLFDQQRRRLARLATAGVNVSYQFNPAARPNRKSNVPRTVAPTNDPVLGTPLPPGLYADYIDFDIPWELSVNYTAAYTTAQAPVRPRLVPPPLLSSSSASASGSVKLTPNLRLSTQLNYDFRAGAFAYPSVTFYRDLHCWQISGTWFPVGITRGYNFTIAAKSSLLQDLKLNRNRTILNR